MQLVCKDCPDLRIIAHSGKNIEYVSYDLRQYFAKVCAKVLADMYRGHRYKESCAMHSSLGLICFSSVNSHIQATVHRRKGHCRPLP